MKVRTKLGLSGILLMCVAMASGLVLLVIAERVREAQEKSRIANEMVKAVFELNILTNQYLMHHEDRAKVQWKLRHDSLAKLLPEGGFAGAEEQVLLERMRDHHEAMKTVFSQLAATREGGEGETPDTVIVERERRLAGQMVVKSRGMVSDAHRLVQLSGRRIAIAQQRVLLLIVLSALGMAGVVAANYFLMGKSISKPIRKLHEGTEIIGAGDLDFRVGTDANDEIGQLSRAFDKMAANLKRVMASRDELEQEIAERERAEEALRASEARFRELYDDAPVGYHELDAEGRITRVNHTELAMLGYSAQEMLGHPVWEFIVENEASRRAVMGKLTGPATSRRSFERLYRRKDGTVLPVLIEDRLLENVRGQVIGIRSTIEDISALKRAEERLKQTMEELERSNKELERFAYVASHDLQEPLRKVRAFGDLLKRKGASGLDDRGRDYLARIQNAASRMSALINDLLAFSRVTTKGQPFVPVDLSEVVEGVLSDLEVRIKESHARVEVEGLPTIDADGMQMRQLFQNLIGNSLKFVREGVTPVVKVRGTILAGQDERRLWRVTVEDNGIGFDEKYADSIFDVFRRLHARDEYAGTGIGLAICRKIVERHGGRITARSSPGHGTTFIVTLPARQPLQRNAR